MITLAQFRDIEAMVREAGYEASIEWSENVAAPISAEAFAKQAIYVICNSGMRNSVAQPIFERCMTALSTVGSCKAVFGHHGKAAAIDAIWANRAVHFAAYVMAEDQLALLANLPFIGGITKYHLARNLGADYAKPDVHLNRLAEAEQVDAQALCERLAAESGYRVGTVDLILWRACADLLIDSAELARRGQRPHQ